MGHGFYQLSPEIFIRALNTSNGFRLIKMILADQFEESPWYEFDLSHRPSELATRILSPVKWSATYLMVLAKREAIVPIFSNPPQQESYEMMWENSTTGKRLTVDIRCNHLISQWVIDLIRNTPLITTYRKLRAVLFDNKIPKYYRIIPSTEWHNY